MKLIELTVFVILFPLFSGVLVSNIKTIGENARIYTEKMSELSKNMAVATGFKKLCENPKSDDDDFDSFAEDYDALFDSVAISIKTVGIKDNKKLLECSWQSAGKACSVLSVSGHSF